MFSGSESTLVEESTEICTPSSTYFLFKPKQFQFDLCHVLLCVKVTALDPSPRNTTFFTQIRVNILPLLQRTSLSTLSDRKISSEASSRGFVRLSGGFECRSRLIHFPATACKNQRPEAATGFALSRSVGWCRFHLKAHENAQRHRQLCHWRISG
jgi:hypothetical protein